jgi:hypothetical protein
MTWIMSRKRIGELLLEKGAISRNQLEAALMIQKQTRARLGVTLVSQGFLTEDQLVQTLAEALAVPLVSLKGVTPEWAAVHMLRARFCETNEIFPYGIEGKGGTRKALLIAMADPLNAPAIQEIEFSTGLPVAVRLATLSDVRNAILRYYHKVNPDAAGEGKMAIVGKGDELEKLERKFWALMRIMARKGLITKDEFRQELDEDDS